MYRYVPRCLDWFGMGHRCFVGTCAGVHLWGFPVVPSINALWFVLFQKLELVFPPKISKLPKKKRKGVVFWHTYDHFLLFFPVSWRKKRLTSPGTFGHLGFLTPRPCRGGTAEEAVQKSAEKKDDTLLLMLVLQGVCWCNLGNSIIYSNDLYTLFATIVIYHYMN